MKLNPQLWSDNTRLAVMAVATSIMSVLVLAHVVTITAELEAAITLLISNTILLAARLFNNNGGGGNDNGA